MFVPHLRTSAVFRFGTPIDLLLDRTEAKVLDKICHQPLKQFIFFLGAMVVDRMDVTRFSAS